MDEKTIKTLRKLYAVLPEQLRSGWMFRAYNVGRSFSDGFGILTTEPGTSLGISIDVRSSFRGDYFLHDKPGKDTKTGAALAAWVATASPETVNTMLDTIEQQAAEIERLSKINAADTQAYAEQQQEITGLRTAICKAADKLEKTFYWSDVNEVIASLREAVGMEEVGNG